MFYYNVAFNNINKFNMYIYNFKMRKIYLFLMIIFIIYEESYKKIQ